MKTTVGELIDKVNTIDSIIDIISNGNTDELYDTEVVTILEEYRSVILGTMVDV